MFSKVAQKVATAIFTKKWVFWVSQKIQPNISATFVRQFASQNFQKSPDLVTLLIHDTGIEFIALARNNRARHFIEIAVSYLIETVLSEQVERRSLEYVKAKFSFQRRRSLACLARRSVC